MKFSMSIKQIPLRSVLVVSRVRRTAVVNTTDDSLIELTEDKFQIGLRLPSLWDAAKSIGKSIRNMPKSIRNTASKIKWSLAFALVPTPQAI